TKAHDYDRASRWRGAQEPAVRPVDPPEAGLRTIYDAPRSEKVNTKRLTRFHLAAEREWIPARMKRHQHPEPRLISCASSPVCHKSPAVGATPERERLWIPMRAR